MSGSTPCERQFLLLILNRNGVSIIELGGPCSDGSGEVGGVEELKMKSLRGSRVRKSTLGNGGVVVGFTSGLN